MFREAPKRCISAASMVERPSMLTELRELGKNCSYILSVLALALSTASYNGLHLLS